MWTIQHAEPLVNVTAARTYGAIVHTYLLIMKCGRIRAGRDFHSNIGGVRYYYGKNMVKRKWGCFFVSRKDAI